MKIGDNDMDKMRTHKSKLIGNISVMAVFGLIMYWLNHWVGYLADDYAYHFFYQSPMPHEYTRTFTSFFDIIPSMVNHWQIWNGRIVAHTMVQWFMQGSKLWFNILNSGAMVLLGLLVALLAYKHWRHITPVKLIWIYGLLFLFLPQFGLTVLWVSGAGNYLWTSLIYLAFLVPFRLNWRTKTTLQMIFATLGMLLLGFVAGDTNENSGPATMLIAILLVVYQWWRQEQKPQIWQITGVIAGFAGSAFMIFAPGSQLRNSEAAKMNLDTHLSLVGFGSVLLIGLLVIAAIIVATLAYIKGVRSIDIYSGACIFLLGAIGSILALVIPSEVPSRLWFGTVLFILIGLLALIQDTAVIQIENRRAVGLINTAFVLLMLLTFSNVNATLKESGTAAKHQVIVVKQEKNKQMITVPSIPQSYSTYDPYAEGAIVGHKPKSWINRWFAKFYGVNAVRTKS